MFLEKLSCIFLFLQKEMQKVSFLYPIFSARFYTKWQYFAKEHMRIINNSDFYTFIILGKIYELCQIGRF